MLELRVLGQTDLRAPDMAAARDLLAQPRPTALLVYLAIANPGSFIRRDHLATLFWPETDQEHARANLRKLMHALRTALGDAAVEARGDEEVRLASGALWCDAVAYEEAVAAGEPRKAIEVYRGPLLPGFILPGSHTFETWLDATRRRMSRSAVKCALRSAHEHLQRQEHTAAGDLIQFVRQLEPELEDEHQLRNLLRLFADLGDRVGALSMYERFRQRMWHEYHAQPAPETRALAEALKHG